jgi:hypothetical protein
VTVAGAAGFDVMMVLMGRTLSPFTGPFRALDHEARDRDELKAAISPEMIKNRFESSACRSDFA